MRNYGAGQEFDETASMVSTFSTVVSK